MNQLIYSPFNRLNDLHRSLDSVFDLRYPSSEEPDTYEARDWIPQVDIRELDDSFSVHADVPGVEAKDIDITLDKNVLTIRGSRSNATSNEGKGIKRRERVSGTFVRQFTLPDTADGERISARANNGVLDITIPKTEKHKPLSIAVQS